jgi:hypothetical protein
MKRPTVASLKKVTPENLASLGAERLAEILATVAETRPELKRRLRMELAAEQGAEHLLLEIDKRLNALEGSRSRVSWRQRPAFVRDVDGLRGLIAGRLAGLDPKAALERMWRFMELHRRLNLRLRDKDGELAAVFARAAADLGRLLAAGGDGAEALAASMAGNPAGWSAWLGPLLETAPPELPAAALRALSAREGAVAGWVPLLRRLADAAGDVDAFRATFTAAALKEAAVAAAVARRLLEAGRVDEAGRLLEAARPAAAKTKGQEADVFAWEGVWIDYLERSGQAEAAQQARWASFERTLSAERARAFTRRLPDFEDVEAEDRAFAYAARHRDVERALQFLVEWPAPSEAARLVEARGGELAPSAEQAEAWAGALRLRQPRAAHALLRKGAAAAFRRRDFATSDRLTREADALLPE